MSGPITLDSPLRDAVGGRTATLMASGLGIETVGELLAHYPRRIEQRGQLTPLTGLRVDEQITVMATVRSARYIPSRPGGHQPPSKRGRGGRTEVVITDGSAELDLVFFGAAAYRVKVLQPGQQGLFAGKVGRFNRRWQLVHPDFLLIDSDDPDPGTGLEAATFVSGLMPIYPATARVSSWTIARTVAVALQQLTPPPDPIPAAVRDRHRLLDLGTALRLIHRPGTMGEYHAARRRLAFEEAMAVQLVLAQRRAQAAHNPAVPRPARPGGLLAAFDAALPFPLTGGQLEVGRTIAAELAAEHPMQRLLQGEVGSGKTVVALRAMLQVVDAGGQAALLAPTEVLAGQHLRTIEALLGPLGRAGQLGGSAEGTRVTLLTGSLGAAARRGALLDALSGTAGIVVGTHALIQDAVAFAELGLAVVDEQHRFGVEQRDALRAKTGLDGRPPHLLVMTATPIPRTVAMTVFGDLDTSLLTEVPPGRAEVTTTVVRPSDTRWFDRVWERIGEEVAAGRQAFVVCPRIGGDEPEPPPEPDPDDPFAGEPPPRTAAVLDVLAVLAAGPLARARLSALHGRLPADEKDRTMAAFVAGDIDVLVATTMVEVGVDVPNASVMVVLSAERFGVSQLHQLRGRIGRGGLPGLCLLVSDVPDGSRARQRLDALAATRDGFELARLDVEQRHEGDVLGAAQSGRHTTFRLLSLRTDERIIDDARGEAQRIVEFDPQLADHPLLAAQVRALADPDQAQFLDKV